LSGVADDDYTVITYEVDEPVAVITLNRPEQLNAWVPAMDVEVRDAVARAAADPAVVGIVITGAGRGFCAGADMSMLAGIGDGDSSVADRAGSDSREEFDGRFTYLMEVPKPVIAAVNGPVAGMGVPFVLCCDIRIVSPEAMFLTAFSQRGLIAEWGISWVMPRLVGPAVTLDLLWTSRRVKGEEAYRLGLANYLVPGQELISFARNYIEELAAKCSPGSMAVMKRQVYEQLHRGIGDAERDSQRLMFESFARPDFKEGVQSFLEKRPPDFVRLPEQA
jgi:enoyl-CoA hydratase/carnithine racemase